MDIVLLTVNFVKVFDDDPVVPENTTLAGLGRSLSEEYNSLNISTFDLDSGSDESAVDVLINMISIKQLQYQIVVRKGVALKQNTY